MKLITPELEARFKEVGNQSEVDNPLIIAKFFDPVGSATWYATHYDAETETCYGYVTGLGFDEWGSFSVKELESIQRPLGVTIERDIYFDEISFNDQFKERRLSELKQNNLDEDKSRDLKR